jgi:UDP-glucose 4-epimerase
MHATIIGSNGYIGRHLAQHWLAQPDHQARLYGAEPHSIDHLPHYTQLNLTDLNAIKKMDFSDTQVVFLLAGITGTAQAFEHFSTFIDVNEKALLAILEQIKATNPQARIVFPSTRLVYKGVKNTPLTENAEKEFKTIYAINKFACEQYLQMYAQYFGIQHTIVRICVPFGNEIDSGYSFGTIGFFMKKATAQQPITLYGDGSQRRSLIYINDLVRALVLVGSSPQAANQTYNIGGADALSIAQIAGAIAQKYGVKVQNVPFPPLDSAIESGDTIFDSTFFERSFDFHYQQNFENWLQKM